MSLRDDPLPMKEADESLALIKELECLQPEQLSLELLLIYFQEMKGGTLPALMLAGLLQSVARLDDIDFEEAAEVLQCLHAFCTSAQACSLSLRSLLSELLDLDVEDELLSAMAGKLGSSCLEQLTKGISAIAYACNNPCAGMGMGAIKVQQLLALSSPLLDWHLPSRKKKKLNQTRQPPAISDLFALMMALRKTPMVDASESTHDEMARYTEFSDAWERYLVIHPVVARYMDPHYVVVDGAPDASVHAILLTLPAMQGGQPTFEVAAGGTRFSCLINAHSKKAAMTLGAVLRSHFAHPPLPAAGQAAPIGGGAGQATRIAVLSGIAGLCTVM